jgi:hypothetical protein
MPTISTGITVTVATITVNSKAGDVTASGVTVDGEPELGLGVEGDAVADVQLHFAGHLHLDVGAGLAPVKRNRVALNQ